MFFQILFQKIDRKAASVGITAWTVQKPSKRHVQADLNSSEESGV